MVNADDRREANAAVKKHLGLVVRLASKRCKGNNQMFDDYFQVGQMGLLKALKKFEPSKGFAFSSFATKWIDGAIAHYQRDKEHFIRPPRALYEECSKAGNGSRKISPEAEAMLMQIFPRSLESFFEKNTGYEFVFLDHSRPFDVDGQAESVAEAVKRLPLMQRFPITMRFYEGKQAKDIAAELGISPMTVGRRLEEGRLAICEQLNIEPPPRRRK